MTFWLTALLIWVAAGARVGRVLVKPATTARAAIVVAVAAVALAVTVAIPEVGLAVDHLLPAGLPTGLLSDGIVVSAWVLFASATSVVASAAWPVVSRRNLRQIASGIYVLGAAEIVLTLMVSHVVGWVVTAVGGVFIVVTGLRTLGWTALGRGIAIYTAGTALVVALAVGQMQREVVEAPRADPGQPGWAWPLWQIAGLLIAFGAVWIVVELWVRARLLLRRVRRLHRVLVKRFPEVVVHEQTGTPTQLKASDQVAQIMDALYLQSGGGAEFAAAGDPPASVTERADRVAKWAGNPLGDVVVDARWIAPPDGVTPRGWVRAIAEAFEAEPEVPTSR
ncbi:hypothetical protein [Nocardia donostiensis]|uniref:Uncharacterized protein n=1 Tax=Nocardia donostiensis TaxID=1538463 RepID=A0A1W0ARK5_9NOCA|nr:hypothetical protein [Nocardia donostiensis]ONM49559.1 hypothetical protein B0T46_06850 [Nocardia donostiensis]OQS12862.1 hypothetical protein B0T36_22440 [Nocardia donostiensis]OQS18344.1 hypothetical protein B0T44_20280 [Nocardia donostiensis]